jgi:hypothetical protein
MRLEEKLDELFDEFVDSVNLELNKGGNPDNVISSLAKFSTLTMKVAEDIILERGKSGREAFIDSQLGTISKAKLLQWRRRTVDNRAA